MKKILIIARHEFLAMVTRKSYIVSTIALPFALGLVLIFLQARTGGEQPSARSGRVGVLDQTGKFDFDSQKRALAGQSEPGLGELLQSDNITIKSYDNLDTGLDDIRSARLDVFYVIKPGYIQTGEIDVYGSQTRHLGGSAPTGYTVLSGHLRAGLIRELLPDDLIQERMASDPASRLLAPPRLNRLAVDEDGAVGPLRSSWERISAVLAPVSVILLLWLSIFLTSGSLLEATVEESKNRVIEVILSSARGDQLIFGKILGLSGAGFLQVIFYLVLIFWATIYFWAGAGITLRTLAGYFIYWMLGHLLYAGLLLATGITAGGRSDSQQLATIWYITALLPVYFSEALIFDPNGLIARTLSYIPLTSSMAMVFRMSKASVPTVDVVISLALLIASIYLVVQGAAKILRTGSLMYGKRFTLPELARWLREA